MERRTRFFWSLAIMFGVVVILWQFISLRSINERRDYYYEAAARTTIGTDEELEAVINSLEANLEARSQFTFDLRNNPMKLNKVVFMTDDYGRLIAGVQSNVIRVSGLYMNFNPPRATAEYQGKEYSLKVGESIGNEKVIRITQDGIVTLKEGKNKFYPLQGRTMKPEDAQFLTRRTQFDEETF